MSDDRGFAPCPWRIERSLTGNHWKDSVSIVDADGAEVCVLTRGYQGDAKGDPCPSWNNAWLIIQAVEQFDKIKSPPLPGFDLTKP